MADFFNGAGGGIIGGAMGMIGNIVGTAMANQQNRENIELQNKLNIEQWNRENEYNKPINQMARLKEAGLNPNLMYGNGAGSMLSAPSPEMQANREIPLQVDPLAMAQIANLNAQTRNIDTDSDVKKSQLPINEQKVLEIQQNIRESQQRIEESAAKIRNMDENTKKQEAERLNIKFDQVMRGKEWKDAHRLINSEIRRNNAGAALDERQFKEMCQTFVYRLTGIKLNNDLTKSQTDYYSRLFDKIGVEIDELHQNINIRYPLETVMGETDNTFRRAVMLIYNIFGKIL